MGKKRGFFGKDDGEFEKRIDAIENFLDTALNWKGEGIVASMQRMTLHFGSKPKDYVMAKTDYPGPYPSSNKRNLPKLMLRK